MAEFEAVTGFPAARGEKMNLTTNKPGFENLDILSGCCPETGVSGQPC
jgi:hypothetical protein